MILPNRQSILGRTIFLRHAGTDHFRQPVDIERLEIHSPLDFGTHRLGPRLGAAQRDAER